MSLSLCGLTAAVALVELDAASLGQFMISKPLVMGPALGFLLGRPDLGLLVGAVVELIGLQDVPAGGHLPLNGTVAASSCLLMALGSTRLPLELAFPAGLFLGWTHARGESFLRQKRSGFCRLAEKKLDEGVLPRFWVLAARGLFQQACWTALLLAVALAVLAPTLGWIWQDVPHILRAGLGFGFFVCPALAAIDLFSAAWMRR